MRLISTQIRKEEVRLFRKILLQIVSFLTVYLKEVDMKMRKMMMVMVMVEHKKFSVLSSDLFCNKKQNQVLSVQVKFIYLFVLLFTLKLCFLSLSLFLSHFKIPFCILKQEYLRRFLEPAGFD